MTAEDDKIDKQRRDLYAVSLAIILYFLAGGDFAPTGGVATPGGLIVFEHKYVLKLGAWLAWVYFVWRYLLAAGNVFAAVPEELRQGANASPFFRRIVARETHAMLDKLNYLATSRTTEKYRAHSLALSLAQANSRQRCVMFPIPAPGSWLSRVNLNVPVNPRGRIQPEQYIRADGWDESNQVFWYEFPEIYRARVFIEAVGIAALRRRHFSDRVLPMLTALAAPAIALVV